MDRYNVMSDFYNIRNKSYFDCEFSEFCENFDNFFTKNMYYSLKIYQDFGEDFVEYFLNLLHHKGGGFLRTTN